MKKRINITIDDNILARFKQVCSDEGFKISTKIEKLIERFMEKSR